MRLDAVFPPMATPLADGEVDARAIASNIARWMRTGLGGIVALGTNGEAALLDEDESDRVIAAARDAVPRGRILIAGTGRESTRATIVASKRAAALGADFVLVRTPSFFKTRMTADAFIQHYTALADACPVPVLLYNFPALTGVTLSPEVVGRLAAHPNIAGMKESGSDAAQQAAFADVAPEGFAVIAGSAPTFYAALCLGLTGGILAAACVLPELCVALHKAVRAGQHGEARNLQRQLTPIAKLVTAVHGVPGLKAAMDHAGYIGGEPRAPLAPASAVAVAEIRAALDGLQQPS
ncbi:MAG: dihydrodipicolinate synthase family protein [Acidobacteria bacterium]|nr:dihydrodipicolinate synthase family protein [Acidobacteriota bacterium]